MGIGRTNAAGGADISGVTATVNDVLDTADFVDANGDLLSGAIPSLAGTTFNVSDSNRTIQAGQYIAGDLTLRAVTTSNITAANIKSGVTVNVGDSANTGRILSVTGTLTSCNEATGTVTGNNTNALQIPAPTGWSSSSTIISLYIINPTANSSILMMCGSGVGSAAGRCVVYSAASASVYNCQIRNVSYGGSTYPVVNAPNDTLWSSNTTFTYKLIWR